METYRRVFGAAEPIRRTMELKIVENDFVPTVVGGQSNIHRDILLGKDTSIDWEDIYTDRDSLGFSELGSGFHTEMEKRMRM
jgi:proteasome maturation protein